VGGYKEKRRRKGGTVENSVWVGVKRKGKKGTNDRKFSVGGYKEKRKRKGETLENSVWVGMKRKGKEREKR